MSMNKNKVNRELATYRDRHILRYGRETNVELSKNWGIQMKNKLLVMMVMLILVFMGMTSEQSIYAACTNCSVGDHERCSSWKYGHDVTCCDGSCVFQYNYQHTSNGIWYGGGSTQHYTKCSVCNASFNYGSCSFSLKCPTCNASGARCSTCYTMNPSHTCAPAHTHTPGSAATCTSAQTCTSCGEVITEALGHNPTGTCSTCGTSGVVCSRCGNVEPHTCVPAHTHTYYWKHGSDPTCTSGGYDYYECSCGEGDYDYYDALGHNHQGTVITSATCSSTGTIYYECTRCSDSYTSSYGPLAHTSPSTWNGMSDTHHIKSCTVCGTQITSQAHYDNNSDGACDVCGYVDDTTAPSASLSATNNANSVTLTGTATDDKGINAYAWTTSSSVPTSWTPITKATSVTQTKEVTSAGTHYFWVRDAGNNSDSANVTVYSIAYNANNGSGAPATQYKASGKNLTVTSSKPTRSGYTFAGWNTNSSGTGTNYASGATYSANASTTLYAKWTLNTFTVTLGASSYTYDRASHTPTITVKNGSTNLIENTHYTLTITGDRTNVGTVTVTAKGIGDYCLAEVVKTYTINAKDISDLTYNTIADQYYNGKAITPSVIVKYSDIPLAKDTDYTVAYTNNTAIGTATATVTGKGNYTGTKALTFKIVSRASQSDWAYLDLTAPNITNLAATVGTNIVISATIADPNLATGEAGSGVNTSATKYLITTTSTTPSASDSGWQSSATFTMPTASDVYIWVKAVDNVGNTNIQGKQITLTKSLSSSDITMTLNPTSYTYNGSARTPTVTVKDTTKNYTLVKDTDYTVAYSNNTNVGTATVTITGKGSYKDTKSANFTISKATPTLSASNTSVKVGATVEVTYTYTGDGTVSATSGTTSVATVTIDRTNKKVTVRGVATGSSTITLSATAGSNYEAKTSTFQVTVTDADISITSHPSNASVKSGVAASFKVVASGTNLTYQWYKSSSSSGSGTAISGATSATYSIAAASVTSSLNGTYYYCNVTNTTGTVSSNRALLTVYYAPTIKTQPSNQTVTYPAKATFTVAANAGNPTTTTYKWQYRTSSSGTWTDISGATSASYTTAATTVAMTGYQYRCIIGNSQYASAATSNAATLTVNRATGSVTASISGTTTVGQTLTASGSTSSDGTKTYQWWRATSASATSGTNIGTGATYKLVAADAGKYIGVTVSVAQGSNYTACSDTAITSATIKDTTASVTTHPSNATVTYPATAKFTVVGSGTNLTYQWQYRTSSSGSWSNITNATSASYTTAATTVAMTGYQYRCVITNNAGSVNSNAATLTVNRATGSVTASISGTTTVGQTLTASGSTSSDGTKSYQWWRATSATATSGTNIGTGATYKLVAADAGKYIGVTVSVAQGSNYTACSDTAITSATIKDSTASVTTHPSNATVTYPAKATFKVVGSGSNLTYQWQYRTSSSGSWANVTSTQGSGGTTASFTTAATTVAMTGYQYRCVITNNAGSVNSNAATLTVNRATGSVTASISGTIIVGQTLTASGSTLSDGTKTYQWWRATSASATSGTNISGATSSTYKLVAADAGKYIGVTVSVAQGSNYLACSDTAITSATIKDTTASVTTHPSSVTVLVGETATFTVAGSGSNLTYQWQQSTNGGTSWSNIANATSASYTTAATTAPMNGYKYRCVITNNAGSVTSNAATLSTIWDISATAGTKNVIAYLEPDPNNAGKYTLVVSGTGAMKNFDSYADVPWVNYRSSVTKIQIGNGVTSVGDRAFYNFSQITSITFPSTITYIGTYSLYNCSKLTSNITIPKGVTSIGTNPFLTVPTTQILVESGNTAYKSSNGVLYTNDGKQLISYPYGKTDTSYTVLSGTTRINTYACYGMKATSVTLPSSLTRIDSCAFQTSKLTSVTIPSGVTVISGSAFNSSTSLQTVYLESTTLSTLSSNAFTNLKSSSIIYTTSKAIADKFVADTTYTDANTDVYYPPQITTQPSNATVTYPAKATFTIAAQNGNPTTTNYQWQLSTDGGTTWTNISGATKASYTTGATTVAMTGNKYRCVISSSAYPNSVITQSELQDKLISSAATLTVNRANPTITLSTTSIRVVEKNTATFTYTYNGDGAVSITNSDSTKATATLAANGATGTVTIKGVAVGTTKITVKAAQGANYNAVESAAVTITVVSANYKIGDTYYETLEEAYKSISGTEATIEVQKNNTDSSTFSVASGKKITLNTSNKTITKTVSGLTNAGTLTITGSGTITTSGAFSLITNSGTLNVNGTGTLSQTNTGNYHVIYSSGTTTVNGETTISNSGYRAIQTDGKLEVKAGNITSKDVAIRVHTANGSVTVSGGRISSSNVQAIYTDSTAAKAITISGGTITSPYRAIENAAVTEINITGGTIKVEANSENIVDAIVSTAAGTINVSGTAEIIATNSGTGQARGIEVYSATVNVTGGKISAKTYAILNNTSAKVNISGNPTITGEYALMNASSSTNEAVMTVTGGTIIGTNRGIWDNGAGKVIVGTNGGTPSTTSPIIRGGAYGYYATNATSTLEFYDGIFQGKTAAIARKDGTVVNPTTPTGYDVVNNTQTIDGVVYKIAYLGSGNYKVGDYLYETLERAYTLGVTGAEGTIEVRKDNTDDSKFTVGDNKKITLDLKGKTITKTVYRITNKGELIIDDSTAEKLGTIQTLPIDTNTFESVVINTDGEITVVNGTLINKGRKSGYYRVITGGNINIEGGTIKATVEGNATPENSARTINIYDGTLNITGGTIIAEGGANSRAIESYYDGSGKIKITGGEIVSSSSGIVIGGSSGNNSSTVEISGGTIKGTNYGIVTLETFNGTVTIVGGTFEGNSGIYRNGTGTVIIGTKGGTPDRTSPIIQGSEYGISATSNVEFYDGIFKGKTAAMNINGSTTAAEVNVNTLLIKESGYSIVDGSEKIGEDTYITAVLKKIPVLVLDPTSLILNKGTTGNVTITYDGDGEIILNTTDKNVATGTVNDAGTAITVNAVGAGSATITVTTAEGDDYITANATISIIVYDRPTAPTITVKDTSGKTIASSDWATKDLIITIGGSTLAGDGNIVYQYSYNNTTWTNYTSAVSYNTETNSSTFYARAYNSLAPDMLSQSSFEIKLDKTLPVTTISNEAGWSSTSVTYNWTGNDFGGSGVAKYQYAYAKDGATTDIVSTSKVWNKSDFPNGTRSSLYVRAVDVAGNVGNWTDARTIRLDYTAPVGSIVVDKIYGPYVDSNTVTINLIMTEDLAYDSEIQVALFNEDEFSPNISNDSIDWMPYEPTKTWESTTGDGIKRVYVIYKDAAGNQSIYLSDN